MLKLTMMCLSFFLFFFDKVRSHHYFFMKEDLSWSKVNKIILDFMMADVFWKLLYIFGAARDKAERGNLESSERTRKD